MPRDAQRRDQLVAGLLNSRVRVRDQTLMDAWYSGGPSRRRGSRCPSPKRGYYAGWLNELL